MDTSSTNSTSTKSSHTAGSTGEAGEFTQPLLSEREHQVLLLASKGQTDQAIANVLGISFATVGTYWSRIRGKLGPYNRTELVAKFVRGRAHQAVDLLKNQNAELVAELHEKVHAAEAFKDAMALFSGVLESAPDGIVVVDANGYIQFTNLAAEEMFGYTKAELAALHVRSLVPSNVQDEHLAHRQAYMANPKRRRMGEHYGTSARRKDGTEFSAVITLNMSSGAQGDFVTCVIRKLEDEAS